MRKLLVVISNDGVIQHIRTNDDSINPIEVSILDSNRRGVFWASMADETEVQKYIEINYPYMLKRT